MALYPIGKVTAQFKKIERPSPFGKSRSAHQNQKIFKVLERHPPLGKRRSKNFSQKKTCVFFQSRSEKKSKF